MKLLRMILGGCIWGEARGYFYPVRIVGLGHDYCEQEDGSLRCHKCGTET